MTDNERANQLDEILSHASALPEGRTDYANIVHMNVSGSDVVLDFYLVTPNTQPNDPRVQAKHIQRIILPINIAREAGDNLVTGTDSWGKTFGITLPLIVKQPDTAATE